MKPSPEEIERRRLRIAATDVYRQLLDRFADTPTVGVSIHWDYCVDPYYVRYNRFESPVKGVHTERRDLLAIVHDRTTGVEVWHRFSSFDLLYAWDHHEVIETVVDRLELRWRQSVWMGGLYQRSENARFRAALMRIEMIAEHGVQPKETT